MERVAILGAAQTRQNAGSAEKSLNELIFEATAAALADAGISRRDVDSVVLAAEDLVDGRGITSMTTATAAGAHLKDEIRVSEDGLNAAALAHARLASTHFDVSLVVSWTKAETDFDAITPLNFDPFYHRPVGLNGKTALALQAQKYQSRYRPSRDAIDHVVLAGRADGARNPNAHLQTAITEAELHNSPLVSTPLRELDLAPFSEGACAVVMARETFATRGRHRPVWVQGHGRSTDSYYLGSRDLSAMPALGAAAQRAYQRAGISDPADAFDIAELHTVTPYAQLIAYEELGFCSAGEGSALELSRSDASSPRMAINPSGGPLSSNPQTATGLIRLIETYQRLRGGTFRRGLAHGTSGIAGQSHTVFVLSGE